MTHKEFLDALEIHTGTEWRNIWFIIDRLPVSDDQKNEVLDQIDRWVEAQTAYEKVKRQWWKFWG